MARIDEKRITGKASLIQPKDMHFTMEFPDLVVIEPILEGVHSFSGYENNIRFPAPASPKLPK